MRPTLRFVLAVLSVALTIYMRLGQQRLAPFVGVFGTPYLGFCLLLLGLTYTPRFGRVWQSATVGLGWLASWQSKASPVQTDPRTAGVLTQLVFVLQTCVLMVGLSALRL